MNGDIVKVSWSGGKDSTAAALLHLEADDVVKMVCYVPHLTDDIPLIMPDHYDFIMRAADWFRGQGAAVWIVKGVSYKDHVLHTCTKGPRKGLVSGFPLRIAGKCNFSKRKIEAIKGCDVGTYDYEDIGIAADEQKRFHNLNGNIRSILVEKGVTEDQAKLICQKFGLYSPVYKSGKRDGCAICPQKNREDYAEYFKAYPEAEKVLRKIEQICRAHNPDRYPLRNSHWYFE